MKSLKSIGVVVFVAVIITVGFWLWPGQSIERINGENDDAKGAELALQSPEENLLQTDKATTIESKALVDGSSVQVESSLQEELTASQSKAKTTVIKAYEDDWCDGATELGEEDLLFAQSELINWHKTIGNVSIHNPNHELASYVAAYKDLPIEELESLALEGDKWAMVAYVQTSNFEGKERNSKYKNRIAKRLMVEGESYYAINHLVEESIFTASIDFIKKDEEVAINRLADALAYMYWGLEHYNHGGVDAFLIYAQGEPFGEKLPLDVALAKAEKKAKHKLSILINRTNKKRTEAGIDFPEPPRVMKTVFSYLVARWHLTNDKPMLDLLRSLDIPTNERIAVTPCTEKVIEANTKHSS